MFNKLFDSTLCFLLSRIDRNKSFGDDVFNAIAKLSVNVAFEGVLLRQTPDDVEVFLTKRPDTGTYAGQWHVPGTIFRPSDSEASAAARLSENEFGAPFTSYDFCTDFFFTGELGSYLARVYLVKVRPDAILKEGTWFKMSQLPDNIVKPHKEVLLPFVSGLINSKGLVENEVHQQTLRN